MMIRSTTWIVAMMSASALGCGGGGTGGDTTPGGAKYSVPAMAGEIQCYKGNAAIVMANGQEMKAASYIRRGWDASSNTMAEDQVTVINGTASRTWQTISVDGSALTVAGKYKGGTWTGTGTGTGDAPPFSAWTTEVTLDVGTAVKSEATMSGDAMKVSSVVYGLDGSPGMTVVVPFAPLSGDCSTTFAQWPPL